MRKILAYLGLADEPAPKYYFPKIRTVQTDEKLSYNQWIIYICEQLNYPQDVIDSYKERM
ncbi:MAG: hypothetical protein EBR30_25570 [Cytophagia bacterium]|jgi:hypothetical protein|nr:hypothetical protein [Cytophagia bacterium]